MLDGYKTYIVALCMIVYALLGLGLGAHDGNAAMQLILQALAIAGLRSGVTTKK